MTICFYSNQTDRFVDQVEYGKTILPEEYDSFTVKTALV